MVSADQGGQHFDRVICAQFETSLCEGGCGYPAPEHAYALLLRYPNTRRVLLSPSPAQDIIEPLCRASGKHDT